MKEKSVLYNPSSANLFADNVLTTGNPSNSWQLLVQSSVAGAGNFLFINMAIDMVESLIVAFNPAGEHDDNLPAKAAPVLLLRPASYTLGVAKIVHLVLIRNIV
jgi:hypothetical protein